MAKKSHVIMLSLLAAFLLLISGFFLGRRAVRGVRISAEHTITEQEANVPTEEHKIERININTATVKELQQLPEIGEVIAARIVEYRNSNNGFYNISELLNVKGIGQTRYEAIKDYVTVR